MSRLRIAIAQINCVVGDFSGNAARILAAAETACAQGADLLLTPELALCGYPAEDLLLRPDFYHSAATTLQRLAADAGRRHPGLALLVGHPEAVDGYRYNAASLLQQGRIVATYRKQRLPNYAVFDEARYFTAGDAPCLIELKGVRCGVNICADLWEPGAAEAARHAGAELLLALNASPFHLDKQARRHAVLRERIASTAMPVIYANLVGGQDELVFDGASFALDGQGHLTHQLPSFCEAIETLDYAEGRLLPAHPAAAQSTEAEAYAALTLGVRDYLGKNGFPSALIGMSGGVDSALTLAIAVDALGADRVRAVMMPSPYTARMSLDDSRDMVRRLGVRYDEIAIEPAMQTFANLLAPQFAGQPADTTEENLQARIRGMILMALSNKTGALVLTTGNKSEMAVGYATLYGDMAGGFAVLKDIYKTFVYRLCAYRNGLHDDIPGNILTRAPSAELKPNQKDQDSLPEYPVLDAIIEAYMEHDLSPRDIIALGHAPEDVQRVVQLLKRNEYKRRQSPVGIRITRRGFGKDWRYPITARYLDDWPSPTEHP
ncbi:MAG: NAD+ synthase [Sterolibacterium sp.]|nr:NAD+ synthase [Sterolibacterium sp.]MBP9799939.1 NAD+ synthase [Sterolibacterium sp.]